MADIGGVPSFGSTIDVLNNAIDGSSREQVQLANNIANVNTPNFRRSTTSFREALAASMGTPANPDALALTTNDDRQFNINGAQPPTPFDPQATTDQTTQMRADHSNVDVDKEMALLAQNSGYQQTMAQLLRRQYTWLRESITGTLQ